LTNRIVKATHQNKGWKYRLICII